MLGGPWARRVMLAAVLIFGTDQLARWVVARAVWRDDAYFDAVVQKADLSRMTVAEALQRSGQALYQGCRWQRVGLIYQVKTCFSLNKQGGFALPDAAGVLQRALALYYRPSRSLATSALPERIVLLVSEDRRLLEEYRNDRVRVGGSRLDGYRFRSGFCEPRSL